MLWCWLMIIFILGFLQRLPPLWWAFKYRAISTMQLLCKHAADERLLYFASLFYMSRIKLEATWRIRCCRLLPQCHAIEISLIRHWQCYIAPSMLASHAARYGRPLRHGLQVLILFHRGRRHLYLHAYFTIEYLKAMRLATDFVATSAC